MSSAVLQINVIPKRMLTKSEAAHHCGRSVKRFAAECPVRPVAFANGDLRYDVHDCDAWLDRIKGLVDTDADRIIARLG